MGYEVVYKFYDRAEDGNYKKDEEKELKKKVGDVYEDITLEKLASVIMAQLARRDIWVFDVKIYEYKRMEISFRETKGGIVIKNKKFMLDNEANMIVQEVREETPQQIPPSQPQVQSQARGMVPASNAQPSNALVTIQPNSRILKYVMLDSDPQTLIKVKASGLGFKPDKRYAVYRETPHPKQLGVMIYTMLDDSNREVTVMDHYFLNADQILKNGFGGAADRNGEPKLSYDGYENLNVPNIR